MTEREQFDAWCKAGNWKPTESMWAAWEAGATLQDESERDRALEEAARHVDKSASYWLNEQFGATRQYMEAAKDAERICRSDATFIRALKSK